MKCHFCMTTISKGEMPKRIEYRGPAVNPRIYGINMKDGPLTAAMGPLLKVLHSKCYWIVTKREERGGDGVQGTQRVGAYDGDDQPSRLQAARNADPGYAEPKETDYHDQVVGEI